MTMVNRRRVMGGKSLPYDAEIEYLQSSGTQWADTLITESQYIDIKGAYCNLGSGNAGFWGVYNGNKYLEHQYSGFYFVGSGNGLNYTLGAAYTLVSVTGNEVYINGTKLGNVQRNPHTTAYTIPLFCIRINENPTWYSKMRVWYFKIWDNNILVRDYIPVRVGSVGYLYDKVSKQLFGNAGTGDFILGPDRGTSVDINVKTHSTGSSDASLDVITGDGEPVNIMYRNVPYDKGRIQVKYNVGSVGWQIYAITPCLYNGQVYNAGDLITNWVYTETKDITIIANYEEVL